MRWSSSAGMYPLSIWSTMAVSRRWARARRQRDWAICSDQEAFVLADGFELIAKAGDEGVELVLVLVGEDREGSRESVLGGVPRGGGFAFRGFRAGGQGGVVLVGGDLG